MEKSDGGKPVAALHEKFCKIIMPAVERHAAVAFRGHGAEAKAEARQAMLAIAWRWFVSMSARGKDGTAFPTAIATLAAKHVWAGRGVCGQPKASDVMTKATQRRHGIVVSRLPDFSTLSSNPLAAALVDNTQTPVPDQVAFRCDFPLWLAHWSKRDRRMILDLAQGERTLDTARKYRISPGRVSQRRREYHQDWEQFHGMAA